MTVHGQYYGQTAGLCGSWDGQGANDQLVEEGVVEEDVNEFGWSWKFIEEGEKVFESLKTTFLPSLLNQVKRV